MRRTSQLHSLLVEILIAILFFALCSCVILEVLAEGNHRSQMAKVYDSAVAETQNLADRLYAASGDQSILEDRGFIQQPDGSWLLTGEAYDVTVQLADEACEAGILRHITLTASAPQQTLLTFQADKYCPRRSME